MIKYWKWIGALFLEDRHFSLSLLLWMSDQGFLSLFNLFVWTNDGMWDCWNPTKPPEHLQAQVDTFLQSL
jgi:hypothetical protein